MRTMLNVTKNYGRKGNRYKCLSIISDIYDLSYVDMIFESIGGLAVPHKPYLQCVVM